ncbi:MAG TPA: helicase C-terminal domain-containing protein [Dehalococcoidia bacterium]|nr:helicase C-terminal domain-containing protein [Dehalococcoidia bacterium]
MPTTYVALDLETTGLSADTCEIIEVGAVKFTPEAELATFHTAVKPSGALPYYIQRLTGIRPDDLQAAPLFAEVASDLEAFLADHPVVGQNVSFDLGFLAAQGIEPVGPAFDTHELATLLLTGLPEYSLRSLAGYLGVEFPVRHRALADAQAARQVFLNLRARLAELPSSLLSELNRIASGVDWPLRRLFDEMLQESPLLSEGALQADGLPPPADIGAPLVAKTPSQPIVPDEVEAVLRAPEANPELFPGFELRAEQLAMAREVADVLNSGQSLIVEAGTGTGKSLAYLAPAAHYALQNETRVVVSTDTINLQEQLMGKDIPLLQSLLQDGPSAAARSLATRLRFAQLKGRRNYLCMLRFAALRRASSLSLVEGRLLARILVWLRQTESGDRAELNLSPQEDAVWRGLSADSETCLSFACNYARHGACFLQRARKRAEASHIVVVNHALLLSDIAAGGHVLPEYRHLVVDEAHNLEEEATQQFGFQATDTDVRTLLDRVYHRLPRGRASGLVESLRQQQRGGRPQASVGLGAFSDDLASAADDARRSLPLLFDLLSSFLFDRAAEQGDYDPRLLLNRAMRVQPDWSNVEIAWENLDASLGKLTGLLARLGEGAAADDGSGGVEELLTEIAGVSQEARRLREGIASVLARDDAETIAWITYGRSSGSVMLCAAPLQVAGTLRARLFAERECTVLTGATLSVAGRFDYLSNSLGLEEPRQLLLGSPFDYARSTLMLLPGDVPEPNHISYQEKFEQAVVDLCRASEGRALVLFTSHGALAATHSAVSRRLEEKGILVLGQGIDGSPKSLLNALRENTRTVILGTSSFWEGVDVAGEALSLLVIARLPFAVPSDPVFVARSELYEDAFQEYALPQAVIRFKQGFGRLIRRKTDSGVVVVMDRRIRSKAYGASFLRSVPPCTIREAPLRELPAATAAWLEGRLP